MARWEGFFLICSYLLLPKPSTEVKIHSTSYTLNLPETPRDGIDTIFPFTTALACCHYACGSLHLNAQLGQRGKYISPHFISSSEPLQYRTAPTLAKNVQLKTNNLMINCDCTGHFPSDTRVLKKKFLPGPSEFLQSEQAK